MPNMDLDHITITDYIPEQSTWPWSDKFANMIIKDKKLSGESLIKFKALSDELMGRLFKNH